MEGTGNIKWPGAGHWVGVFTVRTGVPFSIFDTTASANAGSGYGIPRYIPGTPVTKLASGSAVQTAAGVNDFTVMTLPAANSTPLDPVLGISYFGPFPSNMTSRNMFRGPGAWNFDTAVTKQVTLTERLGRVPR
jgi:hypothetical protein